MKFNKEILNCKIGIRITSKKEAKQLIEWINKYSNNKYKKRDTDDIGYLVGKVIWCNHNYGYVSEYDTEKYVLQNYPEIKILNFNNVIETTNKENKIEEKWMPKQGEMIEVKFSNSEDWKKREFIMMTESGSFLCWTPNKDRGRVFDFARKIQTEPTYYYRYKKLINKTIHISENYIPDDSNIVKKYIKDGWKKIQSTRTTYEELV